jgi:spermidine synthase
VEQVSGVYDVIILDFPDPNTPELSKLYSRSFYGLVASKLSRYGVIVQQSTSPVHSKEAFLCVGRTMRAAGLAAVPYRQNVPTFGEWGWWIGSRADSYTEGMIREGLDRIGSHLPDTRYLTEEIIGSSLHFGKGMLETDKREINTLMNSAIYRLYQDALRKDGY